MTTNPKANLQDIGQPAYPTTDWFPSTAETEMDQIEQEQSLNDFIEQQEQEEEYE